jgi:outer membrane receptor protein involved in Fe transport
MERKNWILRTVVTSILTVSVGSALPVLAADDSSGNGNLDASSNTITGVTHANPVTEGASATLPEVTVIGDSEALWQKNKALDESRDKNLLPQIGDTTYNIDQGALQALPQGDNTPIDKVLLQAPGVSYDSAISNPNFHVRNEYTNVQYRVNGIQLPDGVSALGPILETGFIGNLNLLDGSLPAQYGLRTAGVVDITTKTEFDPGGNVDLYGGTWETFSPSFEYGGGSGRTQYFFTGSYLQSQQGLENAMPTADTIHDDTTQGRFFGYGSTLFGDSTRLTYMAGAFVGQFQIPDIAGQAPLGFFGPSTLDSTQINDNETDQSYFGIVALQTHQDNLDTQASVYARYASIHFVPDVDNDLAFNGVASDVSRQSLLGGLQFDAADHLSDEHTLRAGAVFSLENTQVDDLSTVLPVDPSTGLPYPNGSPSATPVTINDSTTELGWTGGVYVQDEWRLRPNLTLNAGLRFDLMDEFVSANQLSPRLALVYKPSGDTTVHAGVSRYFTPPLKAQSTPNNLALFQNTTQQPETGLDDPVEPERAWYFDVGLDQKLLPGLTAGLDAYYKSSTDTLDDAQFGSSVVLDQFNYASGYSQGAEFKANYAKGGFRAYANLSYEITRVEDVVSNQYVIDGPAYLFSPPDEFAYLANHYVPSSDAQVVTSSFGTSYRWNNLLISVDGIYGSGLAAGFANLSNEPAYTQFNAALAWSFDPWHNQKQMTLRLSVVNIFDQIYLLRSGTGVGELAPQYGPRRGLFAELSQQF